MTNTHMIDASTPEGREQLDAFLATMTREQLLSLKAQVDADESDNQFHLIRFDPIQKPLDIEPSRS